MSCYILWGGVQSLPLYFSFPNFRPVTGVLRFATWFFPPRLGSSRGRLVAIFWAQAQGKSEAYILLQQKWSHWNTNGEGIAIDVKTAGWLIHLTNWHSLGCIFFLGTANGGKKWGNLHPLRLVTSWWPGGQPSWDKFLRTLRYVG